MKNYSKQREEVLKAVKELRNHPTAEEIYSKVKEYNSTASMGTVYRNLKELTEKGVINKIITSNGPDRYDYPMEEHNHVICEICNEIFDLDYSFKSKELKILIKNKTDVETSLNNISIFGICKECRNKISKDI